MKAMLFGKPLSLKLLQMSLRLGGLLTLAIGLAHWPQTLALVGAGAEHADFSLGLKQIPRWGEIIPPGAAFLGLAVLPCLEELWRGTKVRRRTHQ